MKTMAKILALILGILSISASQETILKKLILGLMMAFATVQSTSAATYVYDADEYTLSLNGVIQPVLDFSKRSDFKIRIVFDGENLSGDNVMFFPAIVYAGTRISMKRIPPKDGTLEIPMLPYFYAPFNSVTSYSASEEGKVAIIEWDAFSCRSYARDACVFEDRFDTFLFGSGPEPRESLYNVSVTDVPLQASFISLMLGIFGLLSFRRFRSIGREYA